MPSTIEYRLLKVALLSLFVAAVCCTQIDTQVYAQTPPARTIWDGVYSTEQADRGDAFYPEGCSRCHGDELEGDEAPPLEGQEFLRDWKGYTLADLYRRVHDGMPGDRPGSLSASQTADIIAFILRRNKVPEGKTPMPTDVQVLRTIRIDR